VIVVNSLPWATYGYGYAVCSVPLEYYYDSGDDEWYAYAGLTISGACFEPGDDVEITVCEDDTALELYYWDEDAQEFVYDDSIEANDCGAFFAQFYIDTYYGYWTVSPDEDRTVSVKAWVDGDLMANCPLLLYTYYTESVP
jgi:hypothetical protein